MIIWCAYCRHFIHERRPFADYRIFHGICPACLTEAETTPGKNEENLEEIEDFFDSMKDIARSGSRGNVSAILNESHRLGINPQDLMMGVLQPLLAEIGDLWAANKITVSIEHRFSELVGELLANRRQGIIEEIKERSPELILINTQDNSHTLGLQMAELHLSTLGIPTHTILPGLPTTEIIDLICLHRPKAIGFSLGLSIHMKQVHEVVRGIKELPIQPPRVLVGGPAVRIGLAPDLAHGLIVCNQLEDALMLLREEQAIP